MASPFLLTLGILALTGFVGVMSEGNMVNPGSSYIRPAAVAGSFYPGSPVELAKMLAGLFHDAPKPILPNKPVAIIAPHAGYVYSGGIAACAFKTLEGENYKTVIVISPSHTAYFKGVSAFNGQAYVTPLGEVPIDKGLTEKIKSHSALIEQSLMGHFRESGRSEHALEVQLPFLQTVLGKFSLVALIMGDQDPQTSAELGEALSAAIGDRDDVLIVASSDLSHFHNAAGAAKLDSVIANDIERFDYRELAGDLDEHKTEACGGGPIIAAMIASEALGAETVTITGRGDSGDITGDKSSVVGYLSAVIYKSDQKRVYEIREEAEEKFESGKDQPKIEPAPAGGIDGMTKEAEFSLSSGDQKMLLSIARQAIAEKLGTGRLEYPATMPKTLNQNAGAFVTLHEHGELRGCIGTFRADLPLYQVVTEMARQAAFSDYRFHPLEKAELDSIDIEISVLTPMKRIYDPELVEVGRDGLYIKRESYAGVLLPQVPVEQAWDRTTFLDHTCLKAGLPRGSWRDNQTELYVFQAYVFGER